MEAKSLVEDGLRFTKAKVEEAHGGAGYTAVGDVDTDLKDVDAVTAGESPAAKADTMPPAKAAGVETASDRPGKGVVKEVVDGNVHPSKAPTKVVLGAAEDKATVEAAAANESSSDDELVE